MDSEHAQFYFQLLVTVCVAALGWIAVHWFTSRRDRKNAERNTRLEALSASYFAFVRAGIAGSFTKKDYDGNLLPIAHDVEHAVAAVHLYGTLEQSKLANEYAAELEVQQNGDATVLVNNLRAYVRSELNLGALPDKPHYARIEIIKNRKDRNQVASN